MHLFATVLTYPAPTANYRGESDLNRVILQKITDGRNDYAIVSPESMRNALREILASYGLPCNRVRLRDEEQIAVRYEDYPDPHRFVDDFFFGYLVAATGKERAAIRKKVQRDNFTFKRDSVLRMNLAMSLEPYRHDTVLTQAPYAASGSMYRNASHSSLIYRETLVSAFQYPFALNLNDCASQPEWTRKLLQAIGELTGVAGNHARSYYEMAPASIIVRLTERLVAGYRTYGFMRNEGTGKFEFPEVIDGLLHDPADFPPQEFLIGGEIVRDMSESTRAKLEERGVTLHRHAQALIEATSGRALQAVHS